MRLKEQRITYIASKIVKEAKEKKYISILGTERHVIAEIARVVIKDLQMENKIDEEVRNAIRNMKENIPEGSPKYQAIFRQLKQQIAKKYNYIL